MKKGFVWIIALSIIAVIIGFWLPSIVPRLFEKKQVVSTSPLVLPVDPTDPVEGNQNAPVTIIIVASFNCPACQQSSAALDQALATYPGKVRVVWKDLPENDTYSKQAAIAARCAQQQGKFWEYHDLLLSKQSISGKVDLFDEWASLIGLDSKKFSECRTSDVPQRLVARSIAEAVALDIDSIPYLQINNETIIKGAQSLAQMKNAIEQYIK